MPRPFSKNILLLASVFALSACEQKSAEKELSRARKAIQKQNTQEALLLLERIIKIYPQEPAAAKAAQEAKVLCEKENRCQGKEAFFLKFIISNSTSEQEQISAEKRLSEIYYDGGFYSLAIIEMGRLLSKTNFNEGREEIKLKLARSNFYIKNFYQAEVELNSYLNSADTDQKKFEGLLLKADIQAANKKQTEAAATYKKIREIFPELYIKNQVYVNEALMFEEEKQYDQAIGVLESIKDQLDGASSVDGKIEKLKEIKALMPGASGLKR